MADAAKPRRRWYQYSLRTLMLFVTVCALACSWFAFKMHEAKKQKEAVAAIRKSGGWVAYDYEYDESGAKINGAKPPGPVWLRRVLGDDFFMNVVGVGNMDKSTDASLKCLTDLPQLKRLYLGDSRITDAGLQYIREASRLEELDLGHTLITDAGLEHLRGLTRLEGLQLGFTRVSGVGLEKLNGLRRLRFLDLGGTDVADAGLISLRRLPQLEEVCLAGTIVSEDGISGLEKALPNCRIHTQFGDGMRGGGFF